MITREAKIVQSTEDYLRHQLFTVREYPADKIEILDAFPHGRFDGPLDKNYIATGFNFDDGGRQAELGGTLKHRVYTIEFYIFGTTSLWGTNLSSAVREALENDGGIPLKDIGGDNPDLVIDQLLIMEHGLRSMQVVVRDPRPWQEHTWVVQLVVEDYFDSHL